MPLQGIRTAESIARGSTGVTAYVQLDNTDGTPATGLTYATSGLKVYTFRTDLGAQAVTLAAQTPTGAWTSGGFCEVDATNAPGLYRVDVPDARVA